MSIHTHVSTFCQLVQYVDRTTYRSRGRNTFQTQEISLDAIQTILCILYFVCILCIDISHCPPHCALWTGRCWTCHTWWRCPGCWGSDQGWQSEHHAAVSHSSPMLSPQYSCGEVMKKLSNLLKTTTFPFYSTSMCSVYMFTVCYNLISLKLVVGSEHTPML